MRRSTGFTTLELIIVMSIVSILFGLGAFSIDRSRFAVNQAATGMANNVPRVRFEAIRNSANAFMEVSAAGDGSYQIWADRDNDGTKDASEIIVDVAFGAGEQALVRVGSITSSGAAVTAATIAFDRRGFPIGMSSGSIVLANSDLTYQKTVSFSAVGQVEVQ